MKNLIVADDIQSAIHAELEGSSNANISVLSERMLILREFNVSYLFVVHRASKASDSVSSFAQLFISANQRNEKDLRVNGEAMGLTRAQLERIKSLSVGEFLCVNSIHEGYKKPFVFRAPLFRLGERMTEFERGMLLREKHEMLSWKKRVTFDEVRALRPDRGELDFGSDGIDAGESSVGKSVVDGGSKAVWRKDGEAIKGVDGIDVEVGDRGSVSKRLLLEKDVEYFLLAAYRNWKKSKKELFEIAGVRSASRQKKIIADLVSLGFVLESGNVITGKRGGNITLVKVLDEGKKYLKERFAGLEDVHVDGVGEREHQFYQVRIKEAVEGLGLKAEIEGLVVSRIEGERLVKKQVDVLVRVPGKSGLICVELAVGSHAHEMHNAIACFRHNGDLIRSYFICCENRSVLDRVKSDLNKNEVLSPFRGVIVVCLISDVLNNPGRILVGGK